MDIHTPHNYRSEKEQAELRRQAKEKTMANGNGHAYGYGIQSRVPSPERGRLSSVRDVLDALTPHEKESFRFLSAIQRMMGEPNVGEMEREISDALARKMNRSTQGMFLPTGFAARAGLDTKSGGAGGFTVATAVESLIELLRNKSRLIQMGAQTFGGLVGDVAFPVQLSGSELSWVSENPDSDVPESDATYGQRVGAPRQCQATTSFSKRLLAQSSLDIEAMVRDDIALAHAVGIDKAGICGSGVENQPLGLLGTTGIGSVVAGNPDGATITWSDVVDLETSIAKSNADAANMAYLTTPSLRGVLRQTQQIPGVVGSPFIWTGPLNGGVANGQMNGYPAWVSMNVPSTLSKGGSNGILHALIFGDWSQLYILEWGVMEILIDPYELKKRAMVQVTSFQMVDVLVRQPAAFSCVLDAKLA